jgi:DNA-directed DNA polymerase III PolC
MATSFVPLRLRSRHSRLTGTVPVGEIPTHLAEMDFRAGVLLDTGNLYGAVEFYERCLECGIKPIIGAEVTCPRTEKRIGLVALSRQGYANLCKVLSDTNLGEDVSLLRSVEDASDGLAALSPDLEYAGELADILGRERVWVEIIVNRIGSPAVRTLLEGARSRGLKAVASWDVLFLDDAEERIARVLAALREGVLFSEAQIKVRQASLRACRNLEAALRHEPELLRESLIIADMADLALETGKPRFPHARSSRDESFACLKEMCEQALPAKYNGTQARAVRRLEHELRVIAKLGLADYFLVVREIIDFAVARSIPTAGRGSGAGSLVAYLLDITQVDPIAQGLIFERFLNEHRPDYPDLDIDIWWNKRDEVIDYVYEHFGTSRVAMISTHACFELRSAAREVAKAFGLSPYEAQSVAGRLSRRAKGSATERIERVLGDIKPELPARCCRAIGELSLAIVGFPHHSSVHCGGIVISDRPITYYTPLELAAKGIQVTQFDMHAIEKIGLIKIDLLGNRALTVIEETARDVGQRWDAVGISPDDPATARLLAQGKTLSCFQLESPAMRSLLAMLRAANREEATLALALVRPGPAAGGMKDKFIRRRSETGGSPRDRKVRNRRGDVIADSLPVYEEDVMRIIAKYTGTSLAEADIIRRELKSGDASEQELERKFLFLARTAGVDDSRAFKAWQHVRRFAAYSFCKAHAASYGVLAYAAAYLKANFPLEFYAAALRNHAGMYPMWVHVNEARRIGIPVLLPDINRSGRAFSIEGRAIRPGLAIIKHLSHPTLDRIMSQRSLERFWSLGDFLARVPAGKEEISSLIASGAFDEIEPERCSALAGYLGLRGRAVLSPQPGLGLTGGDIRLPTRAFRPLQKRRMEYDVLGFSPLIHPLELFLYPGGPQQDRWEAPDANYSPDPGRGAKTREIVGLLAAMRSYKADGADLWFLTLDNPAGLHECILPRRHLTARLELGKAYAVRGEVSERFGVTTLRARSLRNLPEKPL